MNKTAAATHNRLVRDGTGSGKGISAVITRGSTVRWPVNGREVWVVSGWDQEQNRVYIARNDSLKIVTPKDIGCHWAGGFVI